MRSEAGSDRKERRTTNLSVKPDRPRSPLSANEEAIDHIDHKADNAEQDQDTDHERKPTRDDDPEIIAK